MTPTKEITYQEAEKIVRDYLLEVSNMKAFCKKNNLSYQYCSRIRSDNTKGEVYSNLIFRILVILGYNVKMKVEKIITYIEKPK